jgi:lipoyl-dependent peroxiredoxin
MTAVHRTAEVDWTGSIARGSGLASGHSGALSHLPITLASRLGDPEGKTSPEELIAAAHAGCFTMALGSILASQGTAPERLQVTAAVTLETSGTPTIASSQLEVHGVVPGADAGAFGRAAMRPNRAARSRGPSRGMSRSACTPRWTSHPCLRRRRREPDPVSKEASSPRLLDSDCRRAPDREDPQSWGRQPRQLCRTVLATEADAAQPRRHTLLGGRGPASPVPDTPKPTESLPSSGDRLDAQADRC